MTAKTNNQQVDHCWSCKAEIGSTDHFCPACGARVSHVRDNKIINEKDQEAVHRDATTGRRLKFAGIVLLFLGFAWLVVGRFGGANGPILIMNWHVPAILLGLFLLYRGKQFIARSRPAELLEDPRPPVVYLRPFKKDASIAGRVLPGLFNPAFTIQEFSTFEEQLADVVQPIGPLVALARPHAELPKPGASRFHAAVDEWRKLVSDLLGKARLVILRPGKSEGLMWETEKAFKILNPRQLLLYVDGTSKKGYDVFSRSLKKSIGISLPGVGRRAVFVAFKDDWRPYLLLLKAPFFRTTMSKPLRSPLNYALEPVFRDLGVEWRPSPIAASSVFVDIVVLVFVFFLILALAS